MTTYYNTKEECTAEIEKLAREYHGVYLGEDVFRVGSFLQAPQEEWKDGKYTGRWYIETQKEVFPCKLHIEKSFLTVGDLKKIIKEECIKDDCILCFETEKGIRLLENNYSYDYLICNHTVQEQHLPTDDIDELESRRYRDTMVLKLS